MKWQSIHFRLTVWYSVALSITLVLFALAVWFSLGHSFQRDADIVLTERIRSVAVFLRNEVIKPNVDLTEELGEYAQAFPNDTFIEVRRSGKPFLFRSKQLFPWANLPHSTDQFRWQGSRFRVLRQTMLIEGAAWQITFAISLDNADATLKRLRLC